MDSLPFARPSRVDACSPLTGEAMNSTGLIEVWNGELLDFDKLHETRQLTCHQAVSDFLR